MKRTYQEKLLVKQNNKPSINFMLITFNRSPAQYWRPETLVTFNFSLDAATRVIRF